jgi:hypothetical protein
VLFEIPSLELTPTDITKGEALPLDRSTFLRRLGVFRNHSIFSSTNGLYDAMEEPMRQDSIPERIQPAASVHAIRPKI